MLRGKKLGVRVPKLAKKRDILLAELAAAKEKVQHAYDTNVVVPKEQENAHSMTEGTHLSLIHI